MGLHAITAQLRESIGAIVPTTAPDIRLDCPRPGVIEAPTDWLTNPDRETRHFDVYTETQPVRSGGCLLVAELAIVVVYRLDQGLDLVARLMAEDAASIIDGVEMNPAAWSYADSLHIPDPPTVDSVEYDGGTPALRVLRIVASVSYRETAATVVTPTIVSLEAMPGQRAILVLRTEDQHCDPVAAVVTLTYRDAYGASCSPAFWADPSIWPTTVRNVDECATVETDAGGTATVELYWAGLDISGAFTVRAQVEHRADEERVAIDGERRWVDATNAAAADAPYPTNGTEAAPWLTITYAVAQVYASGADAPDTAIVIPTAHTYVEGSGSLYLNDLAGLVATVDGVVLDNGSTRTLRIEESFASRGCAQRLVRGLTVEPGSAAIIYHGIGGNGVLFAGLTASGLSSFPVQASSSGGGPVRFVGCSISSTATDYGLYCSSPSVTEVMHCTLDMPTTVAVGAGSTLSGARFTLYDSDVAVGAYFVRGEVGHQGWQLVDADRNTYTQSGALTSWTRALGVQPDYSTFSEWVAGTGNDTNSAYT